MKLDNSTLLNSLVGEVFRLHGALVSAGDALAAPSGLSSARWQVMGTLAVTGSQTVAELARRLGLARQSVQRLVSEMVAERLLVLNDNPQHKRARRVAFTPAGEARYRAVSTAWQQAMAPLVATLDPALLAASVDQLRTLRAALQALEPESPLTVASGHPEA